MLQQRSRFTLLCVAALALGSHGAWAGPAVPAYITAAVADNGRPAGDTAQDADRKPAEVLTFAGVKPGDTVVDLMPGSGYYTRLFSHIVGPNGKVIALQPVEMDKAAPQGLISLRSFAGTPPYANVAVIVQPMAALALPSRVDLVWTSQNYHDVHDPFLGSPDVLQFNRSILRSLKPHGLYVVLDHRAVAGSGLTATDTLHRIDPETVRSEVVAAGFKFVRESTVLRNPQDTDTLPIFDKSIRGKTDRFILVFQKPEIAAAPQGAKSAAGPTRGSALAAVQEWARAMRDNDVAGIERCLSDDWAVVTGHGEVGEGKSIFPSGIKSGYLTRKTYEMSEARVRLYGDVALVTSKVEASGVIGGKPFDHVSQRETDVLHWQDGSWKIVLTHETLVK